MFSIFQQTYVHVYNLLVSFISLAYFSISTIKNKMPNCEKELHKTRNTQDFFFSIWVALYFMCLFIYFHSNFVMGYGGRSLEAVLLILQVMVMQPLPLNNFPNLT